MCADLVIGTDLVWLSQAMISATEHERLLQFLRGVPVVEPGDHDPRRRFAFSTVLVDGRRVAGRLEAAAGTPIWTTAGPDSGTPLPDILSNLARRIDRWLRELESPEPPELRPISSVYVDRYEQGGSFFPHVDRDFYGAVVAGLSVGSGTCVLRFVNGDTGSAVEVGLEPCSLYAFSGPMRYAPWTHEIVGVTGERYGITFRFSAD